MSEVRANTISNAAGTGPATLTAQDAARATAHVNMDGLVISGTLNVSSLTDTNVGRQALNYTTAFSAVNDIKFIGCTRNASSAPYATSIFADLTNSPGFLTTATAYMNTYSDATTGGFWDSNTTGFAIFGDLA